MTETQTKTWITRLQELEGDEFVILPALYAEYFVKQSFWLLYKTYIAVDQWNFNRKLPK